jgi:hypothetical protein
MGAQEAGLAGYNLLDDLGYEPVGDILEDGRLQ